MNSDKNIKEQRNSINIAKNNNKTKQQNIQNKKQKPFKVLNFVFASKKVLTDFLIYSSIIIFIPIILVFSTYNYLKDNSNLSELDKVIFSIGPSLLLINIVIGIYIYKVTKDPQNYEKDQPLKVQIPMGLSQQNKNKRWEQKKKLKIKQKQNKLDKKQVQAQKKSKNQ